MKGLFKRVLFRRAVFGVLHLGKERVFVRGDEVDLKVGEYEDIAQRWGREERPYFCIPMFGPEMDLTGEIVKCIHCKDLFRRHKKSMRKCYECQVFMERAI